MTACSKKICYLTPSVRMLGARHSLFQLATHLDPERYRPVVVCPRSGDLEQALREAGIQTQVLKLPAWRKGRFIFSRYLQLRKLMKWAAEANIALFHANEFHSNPYAARAGTGLGRPSVTHMRLSITPRQIRNYGLERADRVIVVSKSAAGDFSKWDEVERGIRVVYNGLDFDAFSADARPKAFRAELKLSDDVFLVGQVGLISRRKQTHVAIEAFGQLADRFPQLHMVIVGVAPDAEKDYEQQVRRQAANAAGGDRIHFTGFRSDTASIFAAMDLNLLISDNEGFGRVILEAGAFGVPSIGTRIGGIPEIIEDERTGLLIKIGDSAGLAEAMANLIDNPGRRGVLSDAVSGHVREKFSIQAHVQEIQQLYDELLTPGKGGR